MVQQKKKKRGRGVEELEEGMGIRMCKSSDQEKENAPVEAEPRSTVRQSSRLLPPLKFFFSLMSHFDKKNWMTFFFHSFSSSRYKLTDYLYIAAMYFIDPSCFLPLSSDDLLSTMTSRSTGSASVPRN